MNTLAISKIAASPSQENNGVIHFVSLQYPMTVYLAAGTQAEDSKPNFIVLIKMSDLQRTSENEGDSKF